MSTATTTTTTAIPRSRFFSDKLVGHDLLPKLDHAKHQFSPVSTHIFKKQRFLSDNFTFKFSFSDTEPLSEADKHIINEHLKQSSVVSVYSRKDDITIVSTPEEIAMKISSCDLQGFEIEMVLEEEGDLEHLPSATIYQEDNHSSKSTAQMAGSNSAKKKTNKHSECTLHVKEETTKESLAIIPKTIE